jgi:hypothetical protein
MRILSVIITLLLASFLAFGTTPTPIRIPADRNLESIVVPWTAVATSPEVAYSGDIFLTYLGFGCAGTARTITAVDAQGTPITWMTAVPLSANQFTVIAIPTGGYSYLKGGFSLSASGAGVVYQFSGRRQP